MAADLVTLAEAQTHLRLSNTTAAEDTELSAMISAATAYAEAATKRDLTGGTHTIILDSFPSRDLIGIRLARGLVASITHVKYYDTAHVQQTWSALLYRTVVSNGNTILYPAFGEDWPSDSNELAGSIEIVYVSDADAVPQAIKSAILLIVGALYENREDGIIEQGVVALKAPLAAKDLLTPYRLR